MRLIPAGREREGVNSVGYTPPPPKSPQALVPGEALQPVPLSHSATSLVLIAATPF